MKTVFFGPSSSVVKWAWKDIERCSDIEYCEYPTEIGKIVKKLLTRKGMNMVPFCLKRKIYGKILGYEFLKNINRDEEHLFVFTCQNNMFFGTFFISFVRYLKSYLLNLNTYFIITI